MLIPFTFPDHVSDKPNCKEWRSSLLKAAKYGKEDLLADVLHHCSEVDINYADGEGQTSLLLAAVRGYVEVVKILLGENGINAGKARASDGMTPLHAASQKGQLEVVKEIIKYAKLNRIKDHFKENNKGETPLEVAKKASQWEVMKELQYEEYRLSHAALNQSPGRKSEYLFST